MTAHIQQDSKHTFHETSRLNKSYPDLEIRLACVEDGLDNIGFRKFAAFVKSIHENTKVTYITTGNVRGFIKIMSDDILIDTAVKTLQHLPRTDFNKFSYSVLYHFFNCI